MIKSSVDFVQAEIELAFELGVPIIPVLVDGAEMPARHQIPYSIVGFESLNATRLRPGRDFTNDIENLIGAIRRLREQGVSNKNFNIASQNTPT